MISVDGLEEEEDSCGFRMLKSPAPTVSFLLMFNAVVVGHFACHPRAVFVRVDAFSSGLGV